MKNVTLSADASLIEAARDRARRNHTTLNAEFRLWLEDYTGRSRWAQQFDTLLRRSQADPGRAFTRNEMNERR